MEAREAKIQQVLEGSKQFLVPHYQRPYSWREEQWRTLWRDVEDLMEEEDPKPHFLGSIVTSPARSVPEGVAKRLLIDGQQRLTTLIVLLALLRDRAREVGLRLAERVQDLITNRHEEGHDHYKLLPTQGESGNENDREVFIRLVDRSGPTLQPAKAPKTGIAGAYRFFEGKLRRADAGLLERLHVVLSSKLTLVSIILDEKDNPHRIFESLNGKGRPLSQADLIRNFFFMRIPEKDHERVYREHWQPMQRRLGEEKLTDFVRHYLTRAGQVVREMDVYTTLKGRVDDATGRNPVEHLRELARFAEFYEVLLHPEKANASALRERLERLNRLDVTVAYPFLLSVFNDYAAGTQTLEAFCAVLDTVENYLIRRFVCSVPTNGLNKVFPTLYDQACGAGDFVGNLQLALAQPSRGCPRDERFLECLITAPLYGSGERRERTKLILERLEASLGHRERVALADLTIEHVLPQTLTAAWKAGLGSSWEEDHEELVHTLGNLTLTSYNSELGNSTFVEKQQHYAKSHVEMNRYFGAVREWSKAEIVQRAEELAGRALVIWPAIGGPDSDVQEPGVTGTAPSRLRVRGVDVPVQTWADALEATMEAIVQAGEDAFARVLEEMPKRVNLDATAFRRSSRLRKLSNGAYVETNLSAASIHRLCLQAIQAAGLSAADWQVFVDEEEEIEEGESAVQQLRLEFWTGVREALAATERFATLPAPRGKYWYSVRIGRSVAHLDLTASTERGQVAVKLALSSETAVRALELLAPQRAQIEQEIGEVLEWDPYPEKRERTICLVRGYSIMNRGEWPVASEWLVKTAVVFRAAFAQRLADLRG